MSNANVQKDIHSSVDQMKVNKLDRGEMIVPPVSRAEFNLAYEQEDLDWVDGGKFRVQSEADVPNLLEDEEEKSQDGRSKGNLTKAEAAKKVWENNDDLTQKEAGEIFGVSDAAVAKA